MVTLGYSLLRNNFLKRKAKSVPGQHFSKASEGSKGQSIQSQRDLFEKIKHVTDGSPQLCLVEAKNRDEII